MIAADSTVRADAPSHNVLDARPYRLRALIRQRLSRARHFDSELFVDPAWDILLDLGLARLTDEPIVYRAAAAVPPKAIDRWVDLLAGEGLVDAGGDMPRLSDRGLAALDRWLAGH